jgi:hypothetical protein
MLIITAAVISPIHTPVFVHFASSSMVVDGRIRDETSTHVPALSKAQVKIRFTPSIARRMPERSCVLDGHRKPSQPSGTPLSAVRKMGQKKLRQTGLNVTCTPLKS